MNKILFIVIVLSGLNVYAQNDSINQLSKPDIFDIIELDKVGTEKSKKNTNFEHWMYSQKKHAILGYYGAMFQYGANSNTSVATLNHDLGVFYKGKFIMRCYATAYFSNTDINYIVH